MGTPTPNKLLVVIRWVSFLPVAVIAAWLAWIAVNIAGRFSLGWVGITPDDFQGKLYFMTAGHAAMGAAFVYAGAKLAPAHKVIVGFVLGGLGIIIAGFLLYPAMLVLDWWAIWGGICTALGAGAVVWSVHAGEIDLD